MLFRYLLPLAFIFGRHCGVDDSSITNLNCPAEQTAAEAIPDDAIQALGEGFSGYEGWYVVSGCGYEVICPDKFAVKGECARSPVLETVRDRLSLETGCELRRIYVEQRARWSRGGERAYRLNACGTSFVCSTAPGRNTDCKQAFVPTMPAPQGPPPAAPSAPPPPAP
jgi:hypothetical protein